MHLIFIKRKFPRVCNRKGDSMSANSNIHSWPRRSGKTGAAMMMAIQRGWKYYNCGGSEWTTRQFKGGVSQHMITTSLVGVGGVVVDNYEIATQEDRELLAPLLASNRCEVFGTLGCIDGDYRIGDVERMRAAEKGIADGIMSRKTALRELMNI